MFEQCSNNYFWTKFVQRINFCSIINVQTIFEQKSNIKCQHIALIFYFKGFSKVYKLPYISYSMKWEFLREVLFCSKSLVYVVSFLFEINYATDWSMFEQCSNNYFWTKFVQRINFCSIINVQTIFEQKSNIKCQHIALIFYFKGFSKVYKLPYISYSMKWEFLREVLFCSKSLVYVVSFLSEINFVQFWDSFD